MTTENLNSRNIGTTAVAAIVGLVFVTPILIAFNTSLKSPAEVLNVFSLPATPYLFNYNQAWAQIGRTFLNSLMITVPGVFFSVLLGAIAGFPLSQIRGKVGFFVYLCLLTGMLVPYQIVQIPLFSLMRTLGLHNTIPGMWLVHAAYGVPICTFFMRNFFASVPRSMFEAALIDGCSIGVYFWKVLMPASTSGLAALSIIQSRSVWNDLLFAMTLTSNDTARPVTVALSALTSGLQVQHGVLMAATLISILPVVISYLLFQRAFVAGVLGGSSK